MPLSVLTTFIIKFIHSYCGKVFTTLFFNIIESGNFKFILIFDLLFILIVSKLHIFDSSILIFLFTLKLIMKVRQYPISKFLLSNSNINFPWPLQAK